MRKSAALLLCLLTSTHALADPGQVNAQARDALIAE